jgi:DNA-directed RNA polymerase I, II, and III subunit RPABC2
MSDNSDYYSDSDTQSEESLDNKVKPKKTLINPINSTKKNTTYTEYESEIDDDSEPDDADLDENDEDGQHGGNANNDDSELDEKEEGEIDEEDEEEKENEVGKDDDEKEEESILDENSDDNESVIDLDDEGEVTEKKNTQKNKRSKKPSTIIINNEGDDEDDNDDEYEENYLQKFDNELNKNYILEYHPECLNHNYDEVLKLSTIIRNNNGIIIDKLHKTIPYLTKYERARVLGQRAKQIETGSKPFVKVPDNIVDGYIIAELELKEKKIPFIIKRPIPGGAFEYWHLRDLENILF